MLGDRQDLPEVCALQPGSLPPEGPGRVRRLRRSGGAARGTQAQVEQPAPPAAEAGARRADGKRRVSERMMRELGEMLDAYDVVRRADAARKRRLATERHALPSP